MSVKKTKTTLISRKTKGRRGKIKFNNETLQQVGTYVNIGTEILEQTNSDNEIEKKEQYSVRW